MSSNGHEPWNKGLTKDTDPRVAAYGKKSGNTRVGNPVWNSGLTKDTDDRVANASKKVSASLSTFFADPKNREAMYKEDPGYGAVHMRLKFMKTGNCTNCPKRGVRTQMALIHGCATHYREKDGLAYSINLQDYQEMCGSCHNFYDRGKKS
jgi:hypothetical protein